MTNTIPFTKTVGKRERFKELFEKLTQDSLKAFFPVTEIPVYYKPQDHINEYKEISRYKIIARMTKDKDIPLALVGKGYNVLCNRDLFDITWQTIIDFLPDDMIERLTIVTTCDENGRDFCQQWIVDDGVPINESSNLNFRIITTNSYGSKSVKVLTGAIDGFCSNGMVWGEYESFQRKHTSGLSLNGIQSFLLNGIEKFKLVVQLSKELQSKTITTGQVYKVITQLVDRKIMSTAQSEQVLNVWLSKYMQQQHYSVWSFVGAMTDVTSHPEQYSNRVTRSELRVVQREAIVSDFILNSLPELLEAA